eukprot:UN23735
MFKCIYFHKIGLNSPCVFRMIPKSTWQTLKFMLILPPLKRGAI